MADQINGRAKGGYARAAALSPEARSEIARKGANARWGGNREPRPLTGSQLRAIVAKIERHKAAIAKHRDALREVYDELEAIVESADDGLQSLDADLAAFSGVLRELEAGGWRPIESAPKDGTAVWLLLDGHPYIGYCAPADWRHKEDRWFAKSTFVRRGSPADGRTTPTTDDIFGCYAVDVKPTAWMPLPEPPNVAPPVTSDGGGE